MHPDTVKGEIKCQQQQINTSELEQSMSKLETEGKTAMLVAIEQRFAGIIAVADTVKDTSKEAIKRMHDLGLEVIMLTGDNERTAAAIGKQVGIDRVIAEVVPEQKADEIKKLHIKNRTNKYRNMLK